MNLEFFTVDELTKILKVSKLKINTMLRNKIIRGYKIEKEWRVNKIDLENYLNGCCNK